MDAFYNDSEARFTYLSMNGIEKEHWGIEDVYKRQVWQNRRKWKPVRRRSSGVPRSVATYLMTVA